jgi:hypothetical protein
MKKICALLSLIIGIYGLLLSMPQAQAVPAFARQMGVPCNTCHFQHFPMLNAFGRAFKESGFTATGTPLIESDNFSLPANLNAALFTNIRFQQSNGAKDPTAHTSNNGEWIIPGETSLFIGGRISPNMGGLVEGDVGASGTSPGAGFLASIKLPFIYSVTDTINVGVVPFSAGLGPAYAYETLNTGAVGNHFMNLVHITSMSAMQFIQVAYSQEEVDGNLAEGVAAFAASDTFFVTVAKWSPNHDIVDAFGASAAMTSDYVRVAVTPQVGSWDLGFGAQYFGGNSNAVGQNGSTVDTTDPACPANCPVITGSNTFTPYRTRAWAVDGQMQGAIQSLHDMPLGVYISYAQAPGSSPGSAQNIYNPYSETKQAASIAAELGAFADGRGTVQLAYLWAKTGNATYSGANATTLGLTYLPWENVQLALYQTWYTGSAHSSAAANSGDVYGLGNLIDASGSGTSLTSVNLAAGF